MTEGTRTLPSWIDFNPFQVVDSVLGPHDVSSTGLDRETDNTLSEKTKCEDNLNPNKQGHKLTKAQLRNKHVKSNGVVTATAKISKTPYLARRHRLIGDLKLRARDIIGIDMPCSATGATRPYTTTDLGYDINSWVS